MQCFKCDQDAVQECPRCGALYCDDHGGALCDRCMDPVLAVPSYRVFRGSLAALLVGSVVAVWLLVLPPDAADRDQPPSSIAGIVATAAVPKSAGTAAPSAPAAGPATPASSGTPAATPSASPSPAPAPTPAPQPTPISYTVRADDTLSGIAAQFGSTTDAIQRANNISNPTGIQIGQVLTIPR